MLMCMCIPQYFPRRQSLEETSADSTSVKVYIRRRAAPTWSRPEFQALTFFGF